IFQAEDGIRGFHVTGVQTCALPDLRQSAPRRSPRPDTCSLPNCLAAARLVLTASPRVSGTDRPPAGRALSEAEQHSSVAHVPGEIGRASCRERAMRAAVAG